MNTTEEMVSTTLASLYKKGVFQSISRLRSNSSNYPYVTLIKTRDGKTYSTNVYFGKKTSEIVSGTFQKGDAIASFLKNAEIVQTKNEAGETRYKLSTSDHSNYSSKAELDELWGGESSGGNFDLALFQKEFTAQEATGVPATAIEA